VCFDFLLFRGRSCAYELLACQLNHQIEDSIQNRDESSRAGWKHVAKFSKDGPKPINGPQFPCRHVVADVTCRRWSGFIALDLQKPLNSLCAAAQRVC